MKPFVVSCTMPTALFIAQGLCAIDSRILLL